MEQIRKNVIYNVVLNVSKILFPLVTAPYVARVLEPDGVGLYNFANSYAGYFAMLAALGIPTYGIREVAKKRENRPDLQTFVSQMFSISLLTTLGLVVLYVASLFLFDKLHRDLVIFLILGVSLYFQPIRIDWYYQGMEKFGYITARSLIVKTLSVIALFVLVRTRDDLVTYALISAGAIVAADAWNYLVLHRSGIRLKLTTKGLRPHMTPLLLLLLSAVATSFYSLVDTVMLGAMREYDQVAFYSNASFISHSLVVLVTSIAIVVVPRVAQSGVGRDFAKISDILTKSSSVVIFFAVPMSVGIACIAPTFVPLFYGAKFFGSIVPLMIMGTLVTVIGLNNLTSIQILIGMGYDREYLKAVGISAVCNFLLNLLLIPLLGAIGAAVASVFAEGIVLLVSALAVRRLTPLRLNFGRPMLEAATGSVLFLPLLWLLGRILSGWWLVGVFIVTGFLLYVLVQLALRNKAMMLILPVVRDKIKSLWGRS